MEKNKKEKLVPVVVRISEANKNKIKELAEKQGDVYNQMFKEILWNARKKANYYINRDEESEKNIDLYDFYDIAGAIGDVKYRNE